MKNFSGKNPVDQPKLSRQILTDMVDLDARGTILEVGAGKGDFLAEFIGEYPEWIVHALEPSVSFEVLRQRLPDVAAERVSYTDAAITENSISVIAILGVLEHVENPLHLLRWAHRRLSDGGILYVRVPDFANNPNDFFCADHLSKLTVPTLHDLADRSGFQVRSYRHAGVPVFMILEKTEAAPASITAEAYEHNIDLAQRNWAMAKSSVESVFKAREAARRLGEPFAVLGLATAGLFAPFFGGFDSDEITVFLDENESLWGSKVLGRDVGGLHLIDQLNVRHVAVPISPLYLEQMAARLSAFDVQVYLPTAKAPTSTND